MWGLDDISLGDMLGSNIDPMGEASLDSFVDLSTYLMENTVGATSDVGDVDIQSVTTSSQKRSFGEIETVELVDVEDEVVMETTSDHDYVSKRLRLSSPSESSDDYAGSVKMEPASTVAMETKAFTVPVTPEMKYRQRRNKNNVASRRSRETRKQKYSEMDVVAEQLKVDNEKLKVRIVELEKLAKEMKNILVSKLVGK
ncbi:cell death specification protein 2-like [Gigantopelta aegis]|uniref:cell death specification protein 2-like n=1 Tax=Gigantopelta aegis TaxID=1735272 RepID=UPI001B88D885|nr:cell death specification protein 2-like [Gigantopelta aegis]